MSYLRRIIRRTLVGNSDVIKPAITPESIPDYFDGGKSKALRATSSQKIDPIPERVQETHSDVRGNKQAISEDAKASEKMEIVERDIFIEAKANQNVDKPLHLEPEQQKEVPAEPYKPLPPISVSSEKLHELEPETTLRPLNLQTSTMEDKQVSAKVGHVLPEPRSEDVPKGGESPSAQMNLKNPQDREKPEREYPLLESQSKADETHLDVPGADAHPQIMLEENRPYIKPPAFASNTRYTSVAQQTNETIVTVNIGRIELKALPQEAPVSQRPAEFSPPLSLEEYLKQRAKGRSI